MEYNPIVGVPIIMFDPLGEDLSPIRKENLKIRLRDLVVRRTSGPDLGVTAEISGRRFGIVPQPEKDLNIVVEIGKGQVCEILREIISDRDPRSGVDNPVNKPKEILILDLEPDDTFHCVVVDTWIILSTIPFKAKTGTLRIPGKILFNGLGRSVYSSLFYTRVGIP